MKDVAARAGVSQTTVSLVLSGKAGASIPEETQRRIRDAVAELGYRRNALAAGLRSRATDTIGFVSDFVSTTPHAAQMVQGAQDAAWKAGKILLMVSTQGDRDIERRVLDAVLARRVDGIVFAGMFHQVVTPPAALYEVPSILLDATSDDGLLSSVVPDEIGGAYNATRHLIAAGHRRVAYIQTLDDVPAAAMRLEGYRRAVESADLGFDLSLVVRSSEEPLHMADVTRLLRRVDPPTAAFCFSDRMAAGVERVARSVGLELPTGLSLVGFDNQELVAALIDPPLTTMQLPHYEMGRWAVEHLLELIADPRTEPVHHRMPCPLVERASVEAPG